MISDPWFYVLAVPAMLLVGISKSGLGGALGILAVPLMSLAVSPVQAGAVLLPMLCLMDLFGFASYRRLWDGPSLVVLIPGAFVGIAVGGVAFGFLSEAAIRIFVGGLALSFFFDRILRRGRAGRRPPGRLVGAVLGALSGFTSTLAHAGGPPVQVYLLPKGLDKSVFVGTTVVYFLVINYVKLVPYAMLGQFTAENLLTVLVLAPSAPVGIWLGLRLHKRIPEAWFYRVCYGLLAVTGVKLLWDGLGGLGWG